VPPRPVLPLSGAWTIWRKPWSAPPWDARWRTARSPARRCSERLPAMRPTGKSCSVPPARWCRASGPRPRPNPRPRPPTSSTRAGSPTRCSARWRKWRRSARSPDWCCTGTPGGREPGRRPGAGSRPWSWRPWRVISGSTGRAPTACVRSSPGTPAGTPPTGSRSWTRSSGSCRSPRSPGARGATGSRRSGTSSRCSASSRWSCGRDTRHPRPGCCSACSAASRAWRVGCGTGSASPAGGRRRHTRCSSSRRTSGRTPP